MTDTIVLTSPTGERMSTDQLLLNRDISTKTWDNRNSPGGAINTTQGLTHSLEPNSRSRLMPSIRTPKSVQRRDPAIYQDTAQQGVVSHV